MTGLSSAMIAYYDFDTDQPHRDTLQIFYGDIKDGWRGRTFFLMTMISTLHNLSRSLGYVRNFVGTFFGTKTAPQYTVELFRTSTTDRAKFRACFKNTRRYINGIEDEVKEWLRENIARFQLEQPEWWNIDMVGDEFLPQEAIEAEGGAKRRRRSSVHSVREILGR